MKPLVLILGLTVFQPPTYELTIQISSVEKQPASARVLLYQKDRLIKDIRTNGAFSATLPKESYSMKVIRCDTSNITFNVDKKKTVWVVINTDCEQ